MSTKYKLLTAYLVLGMVWCIVTLPNLLKTAGHSTWKATAIALFRIVAWPGLIAHALYTKYGPKHEDSDESEA